MGGKFIGFNSFLQQEGAHFRHICLHTHYQNGVVERKHSHMVETGLTLLSQAHLPLSFLWEAFYTGTYLINRMPITVLNHLSLFQKLHQNFPDYKFLKVFSCSCFPLLRPYNQHKLDFHTKKCVFISYSLIHKRYKCLDKTGKVFVARHVTFNEQEFPYSELFSRSQISVSSSSNTLSPLLV